MRSRISSSPAPPFFHSASRLFLLKDIPPESIPGAGIEEPEERRKSMRKHLLLLLTLILAVLAPSQLLANSFSGRATVVDANALGLPPVVIGDTGPLPSDGGSQDASLLDASVPKWLSVSVVHARTVAMGDGSRSEASVANLNLMVAGNNIGASFLMSRS